MSSIQIEQNGHVRTIPLPAGETLLSVLRRAGYSIPAACGGKGRCGKCRVPVNGVKGRRGVGIDGVRVLSEFTRQIHLDQRGRRLVVLRKFDVLKPDALRFEPADSAKANLRGTFGTS